MIDIFMMIDNQNTEKVNQKVMTLPKQYADDDGARRQKGDG